MSDLITMLYAEVWTDGSGTTGGPAGIAYVAKVNGVYRENSMPLRNATNQQAELLAAALALHELEPCVDVVVWSDSEYLVKGMTEWLPGWIMRDWRTSSGSPVKNQAQWKRLIEAAERHEKVSFRWLRGHAGHAENERCDLLAGNARNMATAALVDRG
jgi:ribonuclease HI